jgi:hypothetical protein
MKLIKALKHFPQIGADFFADERRCTITAKSVNFFLRLETSLLPQTINIKL